MTTKELLIAAQSAKTTLATAGTDTKNNALLYMADALIENTDNIMAANKNDADAARGRISDSLLDRLLFCLLRHRHCPTLSARCLKG